MRCNTGACRKSDAINIQSGFLVVSGDIRSFNPRGQFFPLQLLWRNTSLGQRVCMHDTAERRKNERAENCRITGSHNPFPFSICPRHKAQRRSAKIETNGIAIGNPGPPNLSRMFALGHFRPPAVRAMSAIPPIRLMSAWSNSDQSEPEERCALTPRVRSSHRSLLEALRSRSA